MLDQPLHFGSLCDIRLDLNLKAEFRCAFNRICLHPIHSRISEEFDNRAALIPLADLEILDLPATRLKEPGELNQLALTSDEGD
jgi:hypothetical protein